MSKWVGLLFAILISGTLIAQKETKNASLLDSIYLQNQVLSQKLNAIEKKLNAPVVDISKCESELKKINAEKSILQSELADANRQKQLDQGRLNELNAQLKDWQDLLYSSESRMPHEMARNIRMSGVIVNGKLDNIAKASLYMDDVDSLLKIAPSPETRAALSKLSTKMEAIIVQFTPQCGIANELTLYVKRVNGYCANLKVFSDFVKGVSDSWVPEVIADYFLELKTDFSPYPFLYQAQMGALGIGPVRYFTNYLWMKSNPIDCK